MIDQRMEALAATQHGLITHAQAIGLGLQRERRSSIDVRTRPLARRRTGRVPPRRGTRHATAARAGRGARGRGRARRLAHAAPRRFTAFRASRSSRSSCRSRATAGDDFAGVRIEQSLHFPTHHVHGRRRDSVHDGGADAVRSLCGDVHARSSRASAGHGAGAAAGDDAGALAGARSTWPSTAAGTVLMRTLLDGARRRLRAAGERARGAVHRARSTVTGCPSRSGRSISVTTTAGSGASTSCSVARGSSSRSTARVPRRARSTGATTQQRDARLAGGGLDRAAVPVGRRRRPTRSRRPGDPLSVRVDRALAWRSRTETSVA